MKLSIIPTSCIAFLPAIACAFQPLVTDDTGTQGAGGNQIEAAYSNNRTVNTSGSTDITHEVPLVFTRGITDALDLYVGIPHRKLVPAAPAAGERGWGNPAFGAKWRFHENETSKLSFALKPEIQLPISKDKEAQGLGTARASYGVGLLMTQETGFGAVHANMTVFKVNYDDNALSSDKRGTLYRLSVAPVWEVAEDWKLALDTGLITHPDRTAKALMGYVELGAIYSPGKNLDLAIGIIHNIMDGDARTTQATVGLTWRFR